MSAHPHGKNALKINLNEPAVFLRIPSSTARRQGSTAPPSMLRGLLVLELAKPTKITCIELELTARSYTSWPEGAGARRVEIQEDHTVFTASTVYFRAGDVDRRRHASLGPGVAYTDEDRIHDYWEGTGTRPHSPSLVYDEPESSAQLSGPSRVNNSNGSIDSDPVRHARRSSVDYTAFHLDPISHHEEYLASPPYTPYPSRPASPIREVTPLPPLTPTTTTDRGRPGDEVPHGTYDTFGNVMRNESRRSTRSSSLGVSFASTNRSVSRRPSMEDLPEDAPSPIFQRPLPQEPTTPTTPNHERRGRKHSRFSLSMVSNAILDAMRSPSHPRHPQERELDHQAQAPRGRTMQTDSPTSHEADGKGKDTNMMHKLGDLLKLEGDEHKHSTKEAFKEFKPGTYTFPISISIPANSPPSLHCLHGGVTWRLRAVVHRPGTFKSKMAAVHTVTVVSCPMEEETEEEFIVVERHWEQQLQYLITVSGRSRHIGGTIPVSVTLLPLNKVKIYKLSVLLEERVDYYTQMKRVARTDSETPVELVNISHTGKYPEQILPLMDDSPTAFKNSPLYELYNPETDDLTEMATTCMGLGPWTFHMNLKLPSSCSMVKFTNKNKRANILISHSLKFVIRAEKPDDAQAESKSTKKRLFDIGIHIPITILSCRCSPEWIALPQYTTSLVNAEAQNTHCPCERPKEANGHNHSHFPALERTPSRQSIESTVISAEPEALGAIPSMRARHDILVQRNSQYERLVSGRESEFGEPPPAYYASGSQMVQTVMA